jgi:predicted TIM-barrel fold metal-dependent hydrolase
MPRIVSVDDHVVEPPDLWSSRLPAKYIDVGPRVKYLPAGHSILEGGEYKERPGESGPPVAWWHYENNRQTLKRIQAAAGFPPEEIGLHGTTYEDIRPGCWQPKARIADMELNHVEASLCFPTIPRFCGQIFMRAQDKELALLCVRAYNDWMVEEWCGDSGGRLVPLCIVPLWDVELAVAEVRRNAARGVKAVAFSECPAWLDLPSIHSGYWDPFFAACEETGTVLCMHIGSGTKTTSTSPDAPDAVVLTLLFANSAAGVLDYLMSGVFAKFPRLQTFFAECQIGWIPYVLERADDIWHEHRSWALSGSTLPEPPSSYFRRNMWVSFFRDQVGIELLDRIGEDRVCFEVDFPHSDSTWPETKKIASELFGHLKPEVVHKLARGNGMRMLQLNDG